MSAPGRVNLIGEHTDYNDGLVLPMAIERQVELRVRRRSDRQVVLRTAREAGEITLDLTTTLQPQAGHWSNYVAGVVAGFQKLGWEIPGFELDVDATLPAGGGLSSSAALEVATATAIETLCGRELPREKKALLCQKAEHQFAGVPCGIMDQFAVTFAEPDHALLLDCQSRAMRHVPLSREVAVLVINSGVKHRLADGEYARRRITCQNAARILGVKSLRQVSLKQWHGMKARLEFPEHERARHVITEHERTLRFVEALERSDWEAAGDLMYGSHESLRDDYEVSCLELDLLVEISRGMDGVYGCRMTGGGFGGCVVALIEPGKTDAIMAEFRTNYLGTTRIDPAMFVTRAVGGPHVEIDPA
ncbi:MAG: galactokinase [Verrucomicrobiales bacterium]|nr:galactokinase [Verrucomicrobiales bacterium]